MNERPGPLPTEVQVEVSLANVSTPDGTRHAAIAMRIYSANGVFTFFLHPAGAAEIAQMLVSAAEQAASLSPLAVFDASALRILGNGGPP